MMIRRMRNAFAGLALFAGTLACNMGSSAPSGAAPAAGSSSACQNALYPVAVGVSWTYNLTGPKPDTFTRSITGLTAAGFTDQDVFSSGVTRTGTWNCNNGALVALDPSGGGGSAAVQINQATSNFHTTAMDGVTLPATANAGDTWTQNFTIEGTVSVNGQAIPAKNVTAYSCTVGPTESVTVAAGTFNAVHMDCQTNISISTNGGPAVPVNTTGTTWYAPGVGMVKSDSTVSGIQVTVELTAYHIP